MGWSRESAASCSSRMPSPDRLPLGDPVYAYRFEGQRYDTGRPAGAVAATVAMALEREELRSELLAQLDTLIPTER